MVEVSEIKDRESLEAWLESQPREVAVWIASRAAARVLPVWWHAVLTEGWAWDPKMAELAVLRSLLSSSIVARRSTSATRAAAKDAYANVRISTNNGNSVNVAADAAENAVIRSTYAAANTSYSANASANAVIRATSGVSNQKVWESVRNDVIHSISAGIESPVALWYVERGPFEKMWSEIVGLSRNGISVQAAEHDNSLSRAGWSFWIDWYQSLLDGKPMLWNDARTHEMLTEVVLIEPKLWAQGPDVVYPTIDDIRAKYELGRAKATTPDGEDLAYDAETKKITRRARNDLGEGYLETLLADVLKWLGRFEQECQSNDPDHYGPILWDKVGTLVCYLRDDLGEVGRPPVHYHDLLTKAQRDIEDAFSGGMNFDGPELRRLINLLKEKAQDIRAQSDETRDILAKRFREDFRGSDERERAIFIELCRSMAEECDEGLRRDMLDAIGQLLDEEIGQTERLKALYALYSRLPRGAEAVAEHDPSRKDPPKQSDIMEDVAKRGGQLRKVDQGGEVIVEWAQWVYSELRSGSFFGLF